MSSTKSDVAPDSSRLAELGSTLANSAYARRGVSMSNETIRVMLVDDHGLVREGLRVLLRATPDVVVTGEAGDGIEAVRIAQRAPPDVMVLDLDMPKRDGETTLRELRREVPSVRVLILTMHAEHEQLIPLLAAGARGYLTKDAASHELVEAIRVVAAGDVYVRPTAARLLATAVVPQRTAETARGKFQKLSPREQRVLRAVAEGYSGAEISRALDVSTKTVDAYKRRIAEKLSLAHRTDYVRFAVEAGLLGPSPSPGPRQPDREG